MATKKVAQPRKKPHKTSSYACHICGLNGHKMTHCPKFIKMQKMFHGKLVTMVEVQPIVEAQIVTTYANVVDVNVATRSMATKKQVFKDRERRKANNAANWKK